MKCSHFLVFALAALPGLAMGSKLYEARVVDNEHVMLTFRDSWVSFIEGQGQGMFQGHEARPADKIDVYGDPLDLVEAVKPGSYAIRSSTDPSFAGLARPAACFRRTKVSGTAWGWPDPVCTLEHVIYLKLPAKMKQGVRYDISIAPGVKSDSATASVVFDSWSSFTEAIHVNIIGATPSQPIKSADLYMWMGDGGSRDYRAFIGKPVYAVNTVTKERIQAGKVEEWKPSGPDAGGWNFTRADVLTCDYSSLKKPGRYRLAVEGIGCSAEFEVKKGAWREPYRTSVRGFFYMRIGETKDHVPVPRQPRFIPNVDPPGFKVYLTTYGPWHPDWAKKGGDQWDNKDWSMYKEPGDPVNPNAFGGHSDALDWDRHAGHISIIWDLLLPIFLTNGKPNDDDLGIAESGNGVPDLIDEAQNEVDFWLRLRDRKGGYSAGLNNPTEDHKVMYQAMAKPYMAWASAANAAMLANAFFIVGKTTEAYKYRDAALEAWKTANEEDLDLAHTIGNGVIRGRDLKQLAAACLYNITGEPKWEDILVQESLAKDKPATLDDSGKFNQVYGTSVYLMTGLHKWRAVRHTEEAGRMKEALLKDAQEKNLAPSKTRPSRRGTDESSAWFQSIQEVQRSCAAYMLADDKKLKEDLLKMLILEADWGLGRNPMNMVQMTGLGSRHAEDIYTSGRNDGYPGVHPGHTPYMNANNWGQGFMADPQYYASRGYPAWDKWPHGEALWRAPYCYSNNEFTPQQSMRGKMCLLAFLYALDLGM